MYADWRRIAPLVVLLLASTFLSGQVATGTYPFGTFDNKGLDTINVANLNVSLAIPVLNKSGRGLAFRYNLQYNSSIWTPTAVNGSTVWQPSPTFGWNVDTNVVTGFVQYSTQTLTCISYSDSGKKITSKYKYESNFSYTDNNGTQHQYYSTLGGCPDANGYSPTNFTETASDGSGYTVTASGTATVNVGVTTASGITFTPPVNNTKGAGSITDPNGNVISTNGSGGFIDTTGKVVLTVAGTGSPSSPMTFQYSDTSGNHQTVTVTYKAYMVQTAFGCSGIGEYGPTSTSLVDTITYPDNSAYHFSYEATPGASGNVTGRLAGVQLPQGGTVQYGYTGGSSGIECIDGSAAILTRRLNGDSGSAASTWTYSRNITGAGTSQTTVADGLGNNTVYSFVEASIQPSGLTDQYYETSRSVYNGTVGGTALVARNTCYNGAASPCATASFTQPINQIDTYETLDGIQTHGATAMYNANGTQTQAEIWDFGVAPSRGNLLRKEVWTYGYSIPGLVTEDDVYDGTGTQAGKTVYTYDGTTPTPSSGVPQHVAVSGPRGNLTSTTQYANATTSYTSSYTYEDTGSLLTSTFNGATTGLTYDSTFVYNTGATLPLPSSGVLLGTGATFDTTNTGLPLSSTDPNSQPTTIPTYDSMLRPTEVDFPDGGKTTASYSPTQMGQHTYQSSSVYSDTETQYDVYGRLSRVEVANGQSGSGWYQTDTCYNANGSASFTSYPYQGSGFGASKVCSVSGDTTTFDALGRVRSVTRANGETVSYTYKGRAVKSVDPNGVARISQVDGLGRTTVVCEVSSNPLQGVSPTSCGTSTSQTDIAGTGFNTTYGYVMVTGTTTITQGVQTRTFASDWLGRPTSVTEPERGTTTYTYAYNSTGLQVTRTRPRANQTSSSVLTTTTTQYDSLGRVLSINYSDGTPTKTFAYDASAGANFTDLTQANLKGRLSLASVSNAMTAYSYDPVGRTGTLDECLPSGCGTVAYNRQLQYAYDWAGNLLSSTDGAGVTSNYTLSPASEILSLTSSRNDATDPANLVSNVQNSPNGPVSYNLGNGLSGAYSYDTLGRLNGGTVSSGSTQVYGFANGWKGSQLTGSADSVLGQGSTYGYDEFNRLTARTVNSGTGPNYGWVYDIYGNRWQQNITGGSGSGSTFTATVNPLNNQLVGYQYDAAGNMTNDGFHMYTYDAEGNITAVDGGTTAQYVYNAQNQRVRATVGSTAIEYVFNAAGQRVSEWNGTTRAPLKGKYYWGGKPVAYYTTASDTNAVVGAHFEHQDWLGTERMRTTYNGGVEGSYISLPFGDGFSTLAGTDADANHYGTLDHDAETATDHAEFRQYSGAQGRWLSPDPYDGSYDASSPQSLNRYVYAGNNPLAATDPSGMSANPKYNCYQNGDPSICAINAVQEYNGGGGGGGCTMDGMYAPCSMVYSALQMGAAVQCPNNNCNPTFIGGVVVFVVAHQTGIAYVPAGGPGSKFGTDDQAMIAGALYAQNQSLLGDGNEQCGWTYSAGGQYSYTAPGEGTGANCSSAIGFSAVPPGSQMSMYHSHGPSMDPYSQIFSAPGDPGIDDNNNDVWVSDHYGVPISVATGWGNVMIYYPPATFGPLFGCQNVFAGSLPGVGVNIPICH